LLRRFPSWLGNQIIRRLTGVPFQDFGCTLRAMRRELAEALPLHGEMHRFIPVLAQQAGARIAQIPVRHQSRQAGQSKYGLSRAFRVPLDLITLLFLERVRRKPMHFFGGFGMAFFFVGFCMLLVTTWRYFVGNTSMLAGELLLFAVMLNLFGILFLSLGLLAEMLVRIRFEVDGTKLYRFRDSQNTDTNGNSMQECATPGA
jgi:hypothetical protein